MKTSTFLGGAFAAAALMAGGATLALQLQPDASAETPAPAPRATSPISSDSDSSARRVYDGAKESVVFISSATPQGQSTGSGFVVSADGLIVTNAHVVDGAQQVSVKVGTKSAAQPATVVGTAPSKDLAVLKVDADGLPALPLGDASRLSVGDPTYAIGNPYGLDHTLTTGVVSALNREIQAPDGSTISNVIQTDAAINPGNSGGPLLDRDGKVVGVNSQIVPSGGSAGGGNVGIGFAVPSNAVAEVIAQVKEGGAQPAQPNQGDEQADPYGVDPSPYGIDPDPYGGSGSAPSDPYGGSGSDPYGGSGSDPYGGSGSDPADPYGGSGADPYGGVTPNPYGGAQADPFGLIPTP